MKISIITAVFNREATIAQPDVLAAHSDLDYVSATNETRVVRRQHS